MTYEEFVEALVATKISGREFARLLRLNQNTISTYKKRDSVPSHLAVIVILMKMLTERSIAFKEAVESLDIEAKAARGKSIANSKSSK